MSSKAQHLEEDEIDLRQLFMKLWARRWLIIGCMFFCTAVMTVAAFSMTRIYRATATLIAAGAEKSASGVMEGALSQLGGAASLAASFGGATSDPATAEALAVLQSRQFIEAFIAEKGLLPKLYSSKWDEVNKKWKVPEDERPTLSKAYKYFIKSICTVTQDKKTTLVTLQVDWKDRHQAAEWVNELVVRLNAEMRDRAISKSKDSIEYLEKELSNTTIVGTQAAINRLIETQVKLRMLANVTEEYSFRIIDKALPADEDDPVKPKKPLMVLAGPIFGGFVGVVWVLIASAFYKPEKN